MTTQPTVRTKDAAWRLGVTVHTVRDWAKNKGALTYRESGCLLLVEGEIENLEEAFSAIRPPAFKPLFPVTKKPRTTPPTLKPKEAYSLLGIKRVTLKIWSELGLLPYYLRSPESLDRPRREYPRNYIVGLTRYIHEHNRTKASVRFVEQYRDLCLKKDGIA